MATGETDLEARAEIAGRVVSALTELRAWERLLWRREELVFGPRAIGLSEVERLIAKYSRLCERFSSLDLVDGAFIVR